MHQKFGVRDVPCVCSGHLELHDIARLQVGRNIACEYVLWCAELADNCNRFAGVFDDYGLAVVLGRWSSNVMGTSGDNSESHSVHAFYIDYLGYVLAAIKRYRTSGFDAESLVLLAQVEPLGRLPGDHGPLTVWPVLGKLHPPGVDRSLDPPLMFISLRSPGLDL